MASVWPTAHDVILSCLRWFLGLSVGVLLGFFLAICDELFTRRCKAKGAEGSLFYGVLDFLRALPIIALVPIIQTLGVDEQWKIGLIAWAVMFPIWLSIRQARSEMMQDTELALTAAGLSRRQIAISYHMPKSLRGVIRGVEIAIGIAWLSVVAAEWVGTFSTGFWSGGLGYRIVRAHDANSWGGMLICLAFFGMLGTFSAWVWRRMFIVRWRWRARLDLMSGYENR
jgi:sulfonate transport system permease protein